MKFLPVTKEAWSDFESLFGVRGACGGCWCMLWRLKRSEFEQQKGEKKHREKGLSVRMAKAAIDYVSKQGGKIVEAYPVEPKKDRAPPAFVWTGLAAGFKKAGFVECARRSETRPIMRYYIRSSGFRVQGSGQRRCSYETPPVRNSE